MLLVSQEAKCEQAESNYVLRESSLDRLKVKLSDILDFFLQEHFVMLLSQDWHNRYSYITLADIYECFM